MYVVALALAHKDTQKDCAILKQEILALLGLIIGNGIEMGSGIENHHRSCNGEEYREVTVFAWRRRNNEDTIYDV